MADANGIIYPGLNLRVWPSHGSRTAIVSWSVDALLEGGDFYVYRSPDGLGEWELLNDVPVNGDFLEDTGFDVRTRSRIPHYRVMCEKAGKSYDSAPVGLFEKVSRRDCGTANAMRQTLLRGMRGDGVKVLYYPARIGGLPCPYVDTETGGHYGHGCAGTEDDCFGTGLVGGYRKPLAVWARLSGSADQGGSVQEPDVGRTDHRIQAMRLLGAFVPQLGDLVVLHNSDDRFLVEKAVPHKYRGIIPVVSDIEASLLQRNHDAYRLERLEEMP